MRIRKNILPHVDAASLVAPDAITQPQGHRIDYNCLLANLIKKTVNHIWIWKFRHIRKRLGVMTADVAGFYLAGEKKC